MVMDEKEYLLWAQRISEWSANYRQGIDNYPVRSQAEPGATLATLPTTPPEAAENFDKIFADFERLIPPGLTHWQHPRFFAYFPANATLPSVLAEQLTAVLGANCMLWQTSPVGTEMEIRMLEWLAHLCDLPRSWQGVIQDTASSATLAAVLAAREKALNWQGLDTGLAAHPPLRFYCSEHNHSSIAKALALAGIGRRNMVIVPSLSSCSMDPEALRTAIESDRANNMQPVGVIAVVGATSTGVSDDLRSLGEVVTAEGLFGHVDAAWAGSAMVCPEHRHLLDGLELWDSYVFNPHKWLGTNFDLSAHFVKDHNDLFKTMAATPDYLRTQHTHGSIDFCNWTAPLGRRFRALKLWFVIRAYGGDGLRAMIRDHITWTAAAARDLTSEDDFELTSPVNLALFTFRHLPQSGMDLQAANTHNSKLLDAINADGFLYLTQTIIAERYVLRLQVGNATTTRQHVEASIQRIKEIARSLT